MAHPQQFNFVNKVKDLHPEYFKKKDVVEYGSLNLNGTVRVLFEDCNYTGVDIIGGDCVDVVCECKNHEGKFDTVVSCEMLEHDKDWDLSVVSMFQNCKPGGIILFTCATHGRAEHGTINCSPADSPATNDYYQNLGIFDIDMLFNAYDFIKDFNEYHFEINNESNDLYFYGIKK